MQGGYVKPIIYVGSYKENVVMYKTATQSYVVDKQNVTFGALQIELGKQWVFDNKFLLDIYGGFGYGFDNKESEDQYDESAYNYLNARFGKSPGFSLSGGLKIGVLLK